MTLHEGRPLASEPRSTRIFTRVASLFLACAVILMAAQVGIAGSTVIEDEVTFGGQVGVGGHLTVGRGTVAVGQSGITHSLPAGASVGGYPALDAREWRRVAAVWRRLPELKRRVEVLEARLAALAGDRGHDEDPSA